MTFRMPFRIIFRNLGLPNILFAGLMFTAPLPSLSQEAADVKEVHVKIQNYAFNLPEIHIKAGTKVTWINQDDTLHGVQASDFSSELDADESFSHVYTLPGTFDYECSVHSRMKGKVIVSP